MSARQGIKGVIFGLVMSFAALGVRAATYYVAPNGNDGAAGTEGAPLASLSVALAKEDVTEVRIAAGDYDAMTTTASGSDEWLAIVAKPVAIYGAGAESTVLHCRADVSGHWSCGIHLNHAEAELHGVTVTGVVRTDTADNAYGIKITKGKAFDCVLTGNGNTSMQRNGVLLGLASADAFAYDCRIVDNNLGKDLGRSAVYVANGRIERCTITGNVNGYSGMPAGLYLNNGTAVGCTIADNASDNAVNVGDSARTAGGVIMSGSSRLLNCVVSNNVNGLRYMSVSQVTAGGVYASGTCVISNCTIVANQNHSSIGINVADLALASGTCQAIDCTIGDGFAAGHELYVAGTCLAKNCTVRNTKGLPLVEQADSGQVEGLTLDDGAEIEATRPLKVYVSKSGSGEFPYDEPAKAKSSIQDAVDAVRSGGEVIVAPDSYSYGNADLIALKGLVARHVIVAKAVTIRGADDPADCTLSFENTGCNGAGFWLAHPAAKLQGFTIKGKTVSNASREYSAAAIQLTQGLVTNCVVTESKSTANHSVPPVVIAGGDMVGSQIVDNRNTAGWGRASMGLVLRKGSFRHGLIARNSTDMAKGDQFVGMGVEMNGGTLSDSIIEGNSGGAVNRDIVAAGVNISGGTLERCIIQQNSNSTGSKAWQGGGVYASGTAKIYNCVIAGNSVATSSASSAGGLCVNGASVEVRHVTVFGNTAATGTAGIYASSGPTVKASLSTDAVKAAAGELDVYTSGIVFRDPSVALPLDWTTVDAYAVTAASAGYNAVRQNYVYVETDLLGVVRPVVGEDPADNPDAGAMEKVASQGLAALVTPPGATIGKGDTVTLTVLFEDESVAMGACDWKVVCGDVTNEVTETSSVFAFHPAASGTYTVLVTAKDASGTAAPEKSVTVVVKPLVCYVAKDGGSVPPYDTETGAATSLADAIEAVFCAEGRPGTVYVGPGDYSGLRTMTALSGDAYVGILQEPVRIIATEGPAATRITFNVPGRGACFYVANDEAWLEGLTITGSSDATSQDDWKSAAAALKLVAGTVTNCVMTGCHASGTHTLPAVNMIGGTLADCRVTDNVSLPGVGYGTVWGRGACGIYLQKGTVANCTIAGNRTADVNADLLEAAGVLQSGGTMTGCDIFANRHGNGDGGPGTSKAGGVKITGGTMEYCHIHANTNVNKKAYSDAAGVNVQGAATVRHCLIDGNFGTNRLATAASGLIVNSANAVIDHVTVAGNTLGGAGDAGVGGANVRAGTLKNSIVWGNDGVNLSGPAIYSCAPELTTETGNLTVDPKFRRKGFAIGMHSPCAYAGEAGTYMGYAKPVPDGLMLMVR